MRHRRKITRKTRKHRGGYYGASGAVAPGAMEWKASTEVPVTAGRRRKTRKSRSRKHRGGGVAILPSFKGTGVAGMADYPGATVKPNVA